MATEVNGDVHKVPEVSQPTEATSDNQVQTNGTAQKSPAEHKFDHDHDHDPPQSHDDPNAGAMFQITVKLPHHPYSMPLMVSSQEQVQDVRQSIVETADTFQYTCFHLEHNGERINDFVELSEVKGLKAESVVVLIEDPYTEREARMHVVRIRELIGAAGDRVDQLHGLCAGASLHDSLFMHHQPSNGVANGTTLPEATPLTDYDFQSSSSIVTFLPPKPETSPKTIKSISVSPWNPPPYHLRQRGHLLYLQLTTNEGEQHQITSCVSGFFVNKSSNNKFDPFPRPAPKNHHLHSLLSLISVLSPSFSTVFLDLQKVNGQKDLLTTFPFQNAIPANPWMVSEVACQNAQHQPDSMRAQEAYLNGGGDGAENLRDWNEEFQTTRELPRENLQDRVFRERLTSKLFADYNEAAAKGAVLVARGEVAPLNPTEGKDAQIFIYNNIFFSFGADGVQTFASEGGDEAARVAVGKDVAGVKIVNQLDIQGLYTPATVVVDYLGKRVVGQSIVPGIFKQREPGEHQIDYGGVEGRDVVTELDAFVPVFEKLSKALRVKRHAVWDKEGKRHDLEGSVETKGLLGTDDRKYVLDLYRIAPLDVAWSEEVSLTHGNANGAYPHRMAILRPELVEAYWRMKMQEYVKAQMDRKRADSSNEQLLAEPATAVTPTSAESANGSLAESADKAELSQAESKSNESPEKVGSVDDPNTKPAAPADPQRIDISQFHLALNPDVCSGQQPQTDAEKAEYDEDEKEVRAVCDFLQTKVIPDLVKDLYDSDVGFPMDGQALTQLLHKRGINVRYLGRIASLASERAHRLQALLTVTVQEMVARSFKHIVNRYLRHLPPVFAAPCISHLLNCLLGAEVNASPQAEIDSDLRDYYPEGDYQFEKVTPASLKDDIERQIRVRYRYVLPFDWQTSCRPLQLLREICRKQGFQLLAKDYPFKKELGTIHDDSSATNENGHLTNSTHGEEGKKKKRKGGDGGQVNGTSTSPLTTFVPEDILNITPIVKDAAPRSALAEEALEAGRISLAQNQKQLGQELILESLSLHEQIYGILHPEVAKMYHQLSSIYYQIDEKEAAVELARKAVIVTERTIGLDSHDTVLAYLNLSLFEHHVGNTKQALQYVRHALDVWKIIYGPNHPDSITTMNNAAVMLQSLKQYSESRRWFEACFTLCAGLFGRHTINTATILFQLAQALALDGDPKGAVNRMRDAYNIFLTELGPMDRNTKEAESWLEQLTQNAVSIAKQAKDMQNRRFRRIQYMPRTGLGTRLQPQVGQGASTMIRDSDNASMRAEARNISLDSRSIDELLKYIEGGDPAMGPRAKQKKRTKAVNPKMRRAQELAEL